MLELDEDYGATAWRMVENHREEFAAMWHEACRPKTDVPLLILGTLAKKENRGGLTYEDLEEATGTSRRRVREYVGSLEMHGVVEVERGAVALIHFPNEQVRRMAGEIVRLVWEYRQATE